MACEYCGAPTGYVAGWKLVRANESKREAMREIAALKAENEALKNTISEIRRKAGEWRILADKYKDIAAISCAGEVEKIINNARQGGD